MYEGTYWELLANVGELTEALAQMAVGPAVLEEPVVKLPAAPTLPSWDTFKPVLQPLPPLPQVGIMLCLCCAVLCCAYNVLCMCCAVSMCCAMLGCDASCCALLRCAALCYIA